MGQVLDFNDAPRVPRNDNQEWTGRLDRLRGAIRLNVRSLVDELFPARRIEGDQARIGDVHGEPGGSMVIELAGERAGVWFDHAEAKGGDLIDIWRDGQGYGDTPHGFAQAVADLERHLGLELGHGPKWTGPVARVAKERAAKPKPPPPAEVSRDTYVYTDASGANVLAKVVRINLADGDKTFRQWRASDGQWKSPEVRPLYRLPQLAAADVVVMVEGEKAADALAAAGVPATTAMGGSNTLLDKTDWRPLAGKRVILWPDADAPGLAYMVKVGDLLRGLGCAVATVEPPQDAPKGWDAADASEEERNGLLGRAWAALGASSPAAAPLRKMAFLSVRDLANLRPPEWLVEGLLPTRSFSAVVGPPASYKSFVVLDWALSIAYGRPWLDRHDVKQGPVVYVAGEGQWGLAARVAGWRRAKGLAGEADSAPPFHLLPQPVAMPTGQLGDLLALIASLPEPPVLIVLDTLARCFGGGDENDTKDMSAFVVACDQLKAATGACVLAVHHSGKDVGKGARGSSALTGALDTIVAVKRDGRGLTLLNSHPAGKQKDAPEHADIALVVEPIELDVGGQTGSTLVLIPDESPIAAPECDAKPSRPGEENERIVLAALQGADTRGLPGLDMMQLRQAFAGPGEGRKPAHRTTVDRALARLANAKRIELVDSFDPPIWRAV